MVSQGCVVTQFSLIQNLVVKMFKGVMAELTITPVSVTGKFETGLGCDGYIGALVIFGEVDIKIQFEFKLLNFVL